MPKIESVALGLRVVFILAALGGLLPAPPLPAEPTASRPEPGRVPWEAFKLQGSRFGNSVTVSIRLARGASAAVEKNFLPSPQGTPLRSNGPELLELEVLTRIEPVALAPVTLENRVWFSSEGAQPLQRFRSRRGEDDYEQVFRFTSEGVFRRQREPMNAEEALQPAERWTKRDDSFYPLGERMRQATETSLLIYLLAARPAAEDGREAHFTVFNKRKLHEVRALPAALQAVPVDYLLWQAGGQTRVRRTAEAAVVRMESRPLEPGGKDPEDFSFLGLKEDIAVVFERSTRYPLRVSGVIPGIGRVDLNLSEIHLR
jgi:hypothetical protein